MNINNTAETQPSCQGFPPPPSISVGTGIEKQDAIQGAVVRGRKNPYWQELPKRLLYLREQVGLSATALALVSGVDKSTIWAIEHGGRSSIDTVERLAAALSIPACFLAFGERGERPFAFRIPREQQPLPVGAPNAQTGEHLHAEFAQRLTQARELRGLSLRELSRWAGLSVTAVSNYERSINVPLVDAVEKLAVALDVSPCWLAYGTGDEPERRAVTPSP